MTFENAPSGRLAPNALALAPLLGTLFATGGCMPSVDLKRVTYEALRREDCRLNRLDEYCQRNFANEYIEYERLRRHFMRDAGESDERAPAAEAFLGEDRLGERR